MLFRSQLLALKVKRFKGLEDNSCGEVDFILRVSHLLS